MTLTRMPSVSFGSGGHCLAWSRIRVAQSKEKVDISSNTSLKSIAAFTHDKTSHASVIHHPQFSRPSTHLPQTAQSTGSRVTANQQDPSRSPSAYLVLAQQAPKLVTLPVAQPLYSPIHLRAHNQNVIVASLVIRSDSNHPQFLPSLVPPRLWCCGCFFGG